LSSLKPSRRTACARYDLAHPPTDMSGEPLFVYPDEVRERAVRMVFQIREESGQQQGAIARVADRLGSTGRRYVTGYARRRSTRASARARPPWTHSGSRS